MPRWWKTPAEQRSLLEDRAAHYRRSGALIMKASLEPAMAQAAADTALIRDLAAYDPIREYAMSSPDGAIRSCVLCGATARGRPVDHDPKCLWLRAVEAMRERVDPPAGLPDTELLEGPTTDIDDRA